MRLGGRDRLQVGWRGMNQLHHNPTTKVGFYNPSATHQHRLETLRLTDRGHKTSIMLLLDYQNVLIESLLKDRFNGYVMRTLGQ